MAHFSDEAWADFARGINHSEASPAIQKHLLAACAECLRARESWSRVRTSACAENSYVVPEDAVRMVKLRFEVMHRQQTQDYAPGNLIFDSLSQPAMAGIRAGGVSARQVVYEADGLTVDMRMDRQPRSSRVCVVGQVLAKGASQLSLDGATVILWTEKGEPIVAVKTTTFGEFQLDCEPQNHLRLSIEVSGRRPVRIPLANLKESEN
jgi:hypothetical protein